MIKIIFRWLIDAILVLGGSTLIWQGLGLSTNSDIVIFLGVLLALLGVARMNFRFYSSMWSGK